MIPPRSAIAALCICAALLLSMPSHVLGNVKQHWLEEENIRVQCNIVNKGSFVIAVVPRWAPIGAEQFLKLVDLGFYDGTAMFRAIQNFLVQFGMSRNKALQNKFGTSDILDDEMNGIHVERGILAYAGSGVNSRSTQIWIAFGESPGLGNQPWETPFGFVMGDGMDVIESLFTGYEDEVDQHAIWGEGYEYLESQFPELDYIGKCKQVGHEEL